MVSSLNSSGSARVYCTRGKLSPAVPSLRMLPWSPMPRITALVVTALSSSQETVKTPVSGDLTIDLTRLP